MNMENDLWKAQTDGLGPEAATALKLADQIVAAEARAEKRLTPAQVDARDRVDALLGGHEVPREHLFDLVKYLRQGKPTVKDRWDDMRDDPLMWDTLASELLRSPARAKTELATRDLTPRDWLVHKWLPEHRLTLLYGPGGTGKSYLALGIAAAICQTPPDFDPSYGRPWALRPTGAAAQEREKKDHKPEWFGDPFQLGRGGGKVLYVSWEDDLSEVNRRITTLPGIPDRDPLLDGKLAVMAAEGCGPIWAPRNDGHRDTGLVLTDFGFEVVRTVREIEPVLVILDPLAAAYGGNENDRGAVRSFTGMLNWLAQDCKTTILMIGHPPKESKAGAGDAHKTSGSTDWVNSVRSVWALDRVKVPGWTYTPKDGGKELGAEGWALTLFKSNRSRKEQRAYLRWYDQDAQAREAGERQPWGWELCTGEEACRAYHADRSWPAPEEGRQVKAKNIAAGA